MTTRLDQFRQQYPQYQGLSDQQLGDALYQRFYQTGPNAMSRDQFNSLVLTPVTPESLSQPVAPTGGPAATAPIAQPPAPTEYAPVPGIRHPGQLTIAPGPRPEDVLMDLGPVQVTTGLGPDEYGFVDEAARAATFGMTDQLRDLAQPNGAERNREASRAYLDENPVAALLANLAGGVGGGVGFARAATQLPGMISRASPTLGRLLSTFGRSRPAVRRAGTIAANTAAGAGGAAMMAYSPEERAQDATLGGLIGGAITAASPAAGAAYRGVRNALSPLFRSEPERAAREGAALYGQALERSRETPQSVRAQLTAAAAEGAPLAPADVGRRVQRLSRSLSTTPGEAGLIADEFLLARRAEMPRRLLAALGGIRAGQAGQLQNRMARVDVLTSPPDSGGVLRVMEDMTQAQRAASQAQYARLYQQPGVRASRLANTNIPAVQEAYVAVREIFLNDPQTARFARALPATLRPNSVVPWEVLDGMHRALADRIPGTTGRARVAASRLHREFTDELDRISAHDHGGAGLFAPARAAYADTAQAVEAMEQGIRTWDRPMDELATAYNAMTPGQQEFFQLGMLGAIRRSVERGQTGQGMLTRVLGNTARQEQLRLILGDQNFDMLRTFIERERTMERTAGMVMGGSPTARIMADMSDDNLLYMLSAGLQGSYNPLGAAASMMRVFSGQNRGLGEEVADALAGRMFTADPAVYRPLLDRVERAMAGQGPYDPRFREALLGTRGARERQFIGAAVPQVNRDREPARGTPGAGP